MEDTFNYSGWPTSERCYFIPRLPIRGRFQRENNPLDVVHMETGIDQITRFYNVHVFIAHLRSLLVFKPEPVVRENVLWFLRDAALDWYFETLTKAEQVELDVLPLEQGWFKRLRERFEPPPVSLSSFDWFLMMDIWDELENPPVAKPETTSSLGDIDTQDVSTGGVKRRSSDTSDDMEITVSVGLKKFCENHCD